MGGPLGFGVHTGVIRQHADDVQVVENEFKTGTSGILQESIVTDAAFGLMWAPAAVPPLTATELSLALLCHKVGDGLHDLAIRIDATADVYDKGEATNKALVERSKPDLESLGDLATNDTSINFAKDAITGKPVSDKDVVTPDAGVFGDVFSAGVLIGKALSGQDVDPLDVVMVEGDLLFDALGFLGDPLGSITGPFVGMIIDAIPPLKEMLDATLGDPDGIQSASQSWDTLAKWFVDCGDRYQESLKTVTDDIWHGGAADRYRQNADNTIAGLGAIGRRCEIISAIILALGSIVGDVRSALVSEAVDFVIEQAIALGAATALAGPTFGASVAAFWEEFAVDGEIKLALAVVQIEQGLAHIAVNTAKAVEQEQKFNEYAAKLSS